MDSIFKKLGREAILGLLFFLPAERRIRLERWLRGREEARRLERADVAIVSFGKSGRTWLRVLMSRYYQIVFGVPERMLLGFENYHRRHPAIPRIFFTHDNYIKDYYEKDSGPGNEAVPLESKAPFYGKKVVLLVRNPKDIAVSQYFQWKHRMRPAKKRLNRYPSHGAQVSPFEFVMDPECGLPAIIAYLNLWARESDRVESLMVVRYEDMRSDPEDVLRRVMEFANGKAADTEAVASAVDYASLENMRRLEEKSVFWLAGSRMRPGKKGDPDSYKVRRAKVGGYRDYFDDAEIACIDELVSKELSPFFGYESMPARAAAGAATREA